MLWAECKEMLSSLSVAEIEGLKKRNPLDSFDRPVFTEDLPELLAMKCWLWLHRGDQIRSLDLRGISFSSLPEELFLHQNLECIFLDLNGLIELPSNLDTLPLHTLSLGRNHIEHVPSLKRCWRTLRELNLGTNNIASIHFDEDWFVFFDRGSVGNNPLDDSIGERWMLKADADEAVRRIMGIFEAADRANEHGTALALVQRGLELLKQISEPMIDTQIYQGCCLKDGVFVSPFGPSRGWTNYALLEYFPTIQRTVLIDPSLWKHHICNLKISDLNLPARPNALVDFAKLHCMHLEL